MARALDEIIRELDAGYNPQRQLINERIAALPGQAEAQISGLNAQKDDAFNDILGGARSRGLGFAGIPLAEQAKYTASSFLPAVAKVRQSQNDVQGSLLETLNNANLDQRKTAMSIYQAELDRDERRAAEERAAAMARASGGGGGFDWGSLFGGGEETTQTPVQSRDEAAYLSAQRFLSTNDPKIIISDYNATLKSAQRGNAVDKLKIELYKKHRPDLFSGGKPKGTSAPRPVSKGVNTLKLRAR